MTRTDEAMTRTDEAGASIDDLIAGTDEAVARTIRTGIVTRWLAANDGEHCLGGHSNFSPGNQPQDDPLRGVTMAELDRFQQRVRELNDHRAYGAIQGSRPLTLGYALNDSPAGLPSWIVDKFWAWSDHRGNLDNSFTKDELLTNVMIYRVTDSGPTLLIVEDEAAIRRFLRASLSDAGYRLVEAETGVQGLRLAVNQPPDLVILDLGLPDMDGLEVIRRLRE